MNHGNGKQNAATIRPDTDYSGLVDSIDEALTALFSREDLPEDEHPLRMYGVLESLLSPLGQYAFGASQAAVPNGSATFAAALAHTSALIRDQFVRILRPAYVAASYWSPMDGERHTVHLRADPPRNDEDEITVLAAAVLFFAASLNGPKHTDPELRLYSATHFTATAAQRKRGVRVCYWDTTEYDDLASLWHIPATSFHDLLRYTGLQEYLERIQRQHTPDLLRHVLRNYLVNSGDAMRSADPPTAALQASVTRFLQEFRRLRVAELPAPVRNAADRAADYVSTHFGTDLSDLQALFMAASNVLYNWKACPCKYYYGFPVRVGETCCVMTLGTREHLDSARHLTIARVVSSLFSRALLADHAAMAAASNRRVALVAMQSTTDLCMNSMFSHDASSKICALQDDVNSLDKLLTRRAVTVSDCIGGMHKTIGSLRSLIDDSLGALRQAQQEVFEEVDIKAAIVEAADTAWRAAWGKLRGNLPMPKSPVAWGSWPVKRPCVRLLKGIFVLGISQVLRGSFEQVLSGVAKTVRIAATARVHGNRLVDITIDDDGPGFPADVLLSITRGQPVNSKTGQGLGYVLARAFIEGKNRGRLCVANRIENKRICGARVSVTLEN